MAKHTPAEIRYYAQVIMFNPESQKATDLVWALCLRTGLLPEQVLSRIEALAR